MKTLTLILALFMATVNAKTIAVIGDSASSMQPLDTISWPMQVNNMLNAMGASEYEVKSFAVAGTSFKNIYENRVYNGKNQVEKVIESKPLVVIVMLGANDILSGDSVDYNNVAYLFNELKEKLPRAKIVYLHQIFCDYSNFSSSTIKNKGVIPFAHQRKTTGYLAGTFNSDYLDDPAPSHTKRLCQNSWSLFNYVAGLNINYVNDIDFFKIARLGGNVSDGLHPNYFGQSLLAMEVINKLQDVIPMVEMEMNYRSDLNTLFNELLVRDGDGYKESSKLSKYILKYRSKYDINLSQWYLPIKTKVTMPSKLQRDTAVIIANFEEAYANTIIEVSINGNDFVEIGKTNDLGKGSVYFPVFNLSPLPGKGFYTVRWKIGNIVLGPYELELL